VVVPTRPRRKATNPLIMNKIPKAQLDRAFAGEYPHMDDMEKKNQQSGQPGQNQQSGQSGQGQHSSGQPGQTEPKKGNQGQNQNEQDDQNRDRQRRSA